MFAGWHPKTPMSVNAGKHVMQRSFERFYLVVFLAVLCNMPNRGSAQSIKHSYRFFNDLAVSAPECGPALTAIQAAGNCGANTSPGGFVPDVLPQCGVTRTVYGSNLHWGLSYPNNAGTVTGTYTIHIYVKNTSWGNRSWSRIIDFSNGTSDAGIYYKSSGGGNQRCLDFYPSGIIGNCPFFELDTYYLLTFTRNGATGIIDVYVNNNRFVSYNDAAGKYVGTAGVPILIYRDDQSVVCESAEAKFAYLSFTNEYSSQATVNAVYDDICTIANTNDAARFSVTSAANCSASRDVTVNYTGSLTGGGQGYNIVWDWGGGTVISGAGLGPFTVRYPSAGTKNISLSITNTSCGTTQLATGQVQLKTAVTTVINQAICQGQAFEGYTTTGSYTDVFIAASGCDSTRVLNLAVSASVNSTIQKTICEGDNYEGYSTAGTYTDRFTTTGGCDSTRTLILTIHKKVFTNLQRTICEGESYFGYTKTGVYTDVFTGSNGCDSTRRIQLEVTGTLRTALSAEICEGGAFEGYTRPGTYIDSYMSVNGCDSIRTLTLSIKPLPSLNLGPDQAICSDDTIVLNAGVHDSYTWQDGSTGSTFTVKQPGVYSVTVSNICGTSTDNVTITTTYCDIVFPTGFTPNGDGRNDHFKIIRSGRIDSYRLEVFNRWGQKVFSGNDPARGWDGTMSGKQADTGIYVWDCTIKRGGETKKIKGAVNLIR